MKNMDIPNKEELIKVMRQNHIVFAAIFGSRAKGTARPDSDYDFLVEFEKNYPVPFSKLFRARDQVKNTLGEDIELVTIGALHPLMKDEIFKTMKVLYGKRER